mmetsp:Transcript_63174/g.150634  ORF Transcript_63174/g.150634 Transcript_63174/m.150634 type:complete len:276 (+) Transcript_63174:109-936(+)
MVRLELRSSKQSQLQHPRSSALLHLVLLLLLSAVAPLHRCLLCFTVPQPVRPVRLERVALQAAEPLAVPEKVSDSEQLADIPDKSLRIGQRVRGMVVGVLKWAVFVDIGAEGYAYMPRELVWTPSQTFKPRKEAKVVKIGDTVTAYVERLPERGTDLGRVKLNADSSDISIFSQRDLTSAEPFQQKVGQRIVGVVHKVHRAGLFVALPSDDNGKHALGLVPASALCDKDYSPEMFSDLLGESVEAEVRAVSPPDARKKQSKWNMLLRLSARPFPV